MYRLLKSSGPERIEAEWQRTDTRLDYILPPPTKEEEAEKQKALLDPRSEPNPRDRLAAFDPDLVVRDYYLAEDEAGQRFWLFRQGVYDNHHQWFIHGLFA